MTVKDAIPSWPDLTWSKSFSGMDSFRVDPETAFIVRVESVNTNQGQKIILLTVQTMDNPSVQAVIPSKDIVPSDEIVFDRVVKSLQSSIGKTLSEAGLRNL